MSSLTVYSTYLNKKYRFKVGCKYSPKPWWAVLEVCRSDKAKVFSVLAVSNAYIIKLVHLNTFRYPVRTKVFQLILKRCKFL